MTDRVIQNEAFQEFVISFHAADRIAERVKVSPKKSLKMVAKAWKSTLKVSKLRRLEYGNMHRSDGKMKNVRFRFYLGHVWVFAVKLAIGERRSQKVLITVY